MSQWNYKNIVQVLACETKKNSVHFYDIFMRVDCEKITVK